MNRYFPDHRKPLQALIAEYVVCPAKAAEDPVAFETDPARNGAFVKTVENVYDFRCAACGLRFWFEDLTLVDACHLIPFSESFNDHPTNGISLCKNHHWALDRHLSAPADDAGRLVWRPSPLLDDRIEGQEEVVRLDGKYVILPRERKFHPAEDAVAWRVARLLGRGRWKLKGKSQKVEGREPERGRGTWGRGARDGGHTSRDQEVGLKHRPTWRSCEAVAPFFRRRRPGASRGTGEWANRRGKFPFEHRQDRGDCD